MTGSNHKEFCIELGKSGLLRWLLSFLFNAGVVGDIMQVRPLQINSLFNETPGEWNRVGR